MSAEDAENPHNKKQNMTEDQCNVIIDFMATHTLFAANCSMGCDPQKTKDRLGQELTNFVNKAGPTKTIKQVLDCWKYIRRKAKKYNAEKKQEKKKTGNVQDKPFINNLKYEKVLQITGTSHGCGLELGEEDGFPIVKAEQIEEVDDTVAHVKDTPIRKILESKTHSGTRGSLIDIKLLNAPNNRVVYSRPLQVKSEASGHNNEYAESFANAISSVETVKVGNTVAHVKGTQKRKLYESTCSDTPIRKILFSNLHKEATTVRGNSSAEGIDVQLPNTPQHRLVYPSNGKTEASGGHNQYTESFKEYAQKYKKKSSPAQARSEMALTCITEGNNSIKILTESVIDLKSTNIQRNQLVKEQNDLLRKLIGIQNEEKKQKEDKNKENDEK